MARILPLFFLILFASCSQNLKSNKIHYLFTKKIIKNTVIPPDFGFYSIRGHFFQKNNCVDYIFFNNRDLLFFTDSTQTIIRTENKIIEQIFSINSDDSNTYKLATTGQLYRLENNKFIPLENLNKVPKMVNSNMIVSAYYKSQNYFHVYKNEIIFPIISKKDIYSFNPMFGSYNLTTGRIKFLPVKTDATFIEYQYGSNNIFLSQLKGDTLIIHYPYSPELTFFSLSKNKVLRRIDPFYNQANDQPKAFTKLEDPEAFYRYNLESPAFGPLIYNPYKKHFYRFYRLALDRKNEKDEFTIEEDKKNTILVYDSNFSYLGQIFLPKKFYLLNEITPSKSGFILGTNFKVQKENLAFYEISYH